MPKAEQDMLSFHLSGLTLPFCAFSVFCKWQHRFAWPESCWKALCDHFPEILGTPWCHCGTICTFIFLDCIGYISPTASLNHSNPIDLKSSLWELSGDTRVYGIPWHCCDVICVFVLMYYSTGCLLVSVLPPGDAHSSFLDRLHVANLPSSCSMSGSSSFGIGHAQLCWHVWVKIFTHGMLNLQFYLELDPCLCLCLYLHSVMVHASIYGGQEIFTCTCVHWNANTCPMIFPKQELLWLEKI